MKIMVVLDIENYIKAYSEVGSIQNGIEITVPNSLVLREETYKMVWDKINNIFLQESLIKISEELKEEFILYYNCYKLENEILIFDENRKNELEDLKSRKEIDSLKMKLMELNQKKEFFEFKKWDITELNIEMENLENEIKKLELRGEQNGIEI